MSCQAILVENVSPEFYEVLIAKAKAAGAVFTPGKALIRGMEFDWYYDQETGSISVTCVQKPFFISCALVEEKMRAMVEEARQS